MPPIRPPTSTTNRFEIAWRVIVQRRCPRNRACSLIIVEPEMHSRRIGAPLHRDLHRLLTSLLRLGSGGHVKAHLSILFIAACASNTSVGNDGHDQLVPPVDGMEVQGEYLLGKTVDGFGEDPVYHISVGTDGFDAAGNPVVVRFFGSASLELGSHRGADPAFDGVVLHSDSGELRLTVSRGGSDVAFYHLEHRSTPSDPWTDPCAGGTYDDAVPLAGVWRRNGLHE